MSWYVKAMKNYANFSGRARRKEYWMFNLFNAIFLLAAIILDAILFPQTGDRYHVQTRVFYWLYALAVILPSIAVRVRRLHDQGKSGAWYFIGWIPLIGGIWMLILMCTEGAYGPNQYGDDPKANPE